MTETEVRAWINANIKKNDRNLISAETVNTALNHILDLAAFRDNVLKSYSFTISNDDLDENLSAILNHGLGTYFPEINLLNENNEYISTEYFTLESIDENSSKITFYDNIPATGNGYYPGVLSKVVETIPVPHIPEQGEEFYDDFSTWTGSGYETLPEDWTAEGTLDENNHAENDSNRMKIYKDSSSNLVKFIIPFDFIVNANYKLRFNLVQGKLLIRVGYGINYTFSVAGINEISGYAPVSSISISALEDETIIDDLQIIKLPS